MRKLPVYLLIDTSESMAGDPIEAVKNGLAAMLQVLLKNPHALETVWLSIITFDARAKVVLPMTELPDVQIPEISIKPGTALGAALQLLAIRIKKDVQRTTAESKGDWRPIVFLLTDGQPTDQWEKAAETLKNVNPKIASIYAIGCGKDVDYNVLNEVGDIAYLLYDLSAELISKFFVWITASVQTMSQGADGPLSLDKSSFGSDGGFEIIDSDHLPESSEFPLQVFLHSRCVKTKQNYMLRYVYLDQHRVYLAKQAHELPEDFFSEGGDVDLDIPSELLFGSAPCPFCGGEGWGQCGNCGQIFCSTEDPPPQVVCPNCGNTLTMCETSESFRVNRSSG